jgi:uncharacterized protein YjbI with pentapeptide repeats
MKRNIIGFILMILLFLSSFGGEIIDGKKVFSNEEILESFNSGNVIWNKFRNENQDIEFGTFFENRDLKKKDMSKFNLKGISFKDSNMAGAILVEADMEECNLENVNLYKADLKEANLKSANLLKSNLDNTGMYNANMENAKVQLKWKDKLSKRNVNKFRLIDWKK